VINISKGPGGEYLHLTVLIGFDRRNGQVYGTFVHASVQAEDAAAIARTRERFLVDLSAHPGRVPGEIDVIGIPVHEMPAGSVDRVDPTSRKLVVKPSDPHLSTLTQP
jgi:hypothetical protein